MPAEANRSATNGLPVPAAFRELTGLAAGPFDQKESMTKRILTRATPAGAQLTRVPTSPVGPLGMSPHTTTTGKKQRPTRTFSSLTPDT